MQICNKKSKEAHKNSEYVACCSGYTDILWCCSIQYCYCSNILHSIYKPTYKSVIGIAINIYLFIITTKKPVMEMNLRSSIVDDSVKMLLTSTPLLLSILVHVDTDIPLLQQKQIIQSS